MLDKSVPFHSIIMMRPYSQPKTEKPLPHGCKAVPYEKGLERAWAEIEASVLEFESVEEALKCHSYYLAYLDELKKRQWFVLTPDGVPAATATAWFCQTDNGTVPVVHALGCRPEFQGRGLGRAAAVKMLQSFYELDKGRDVWLDTQTWSYRAIGLYLSLGFRPMKTAVFNSAANEYEAALPILREHMSEEYFRIFTECAE